MPIISPIQSPYLGEVTVGSGNALIGSVNTIAVGAAGATNIQNSAGWIVGLAAGSGWVGTMNTIAIGAGDTVSVVNSAGWVMATTASQVGTWRTFLQSSDNLIGTMNTLAIGAGSTVDIVNSAGWIVAVSNTQTAINIINSAGWVFNQANTAGQTVSVINSAGWVVSQINTAGMTVSVINSAGWLINVINTASNVNVINTAGMTLGSTTNRIGGIYTIAGIVLNESGNVLAVQTATSRATVAGNSLILAAISGNAYRVLGYRVQALTTSTVKFTDSGAASSDLTPTFLFGDREGMVATAYPGAYEFQTATSRGLYVNLAAAGTLTTLLHYVVTS